MKNRSKTRRPLGLRNDISVLEQKLGPIVYRPLASLRRYANNPRKHSENQLAKLTASIQEFGFAMPVLIDENATIIAGEARVEAAQRAGMIEVPVIVAHHWSAAQVRAYRLADNRLAELGTWDEDVLSIELAAIIELEDSPIEILGWEAAEIDLMLPNGTSELEAKCTNKVDKQVSPPANPISRPGDLWILGDHRLLCGSSLDASNWKQLLGDNTAAMAFTTLAKAEPAAYQLGENRSCDLAGPASIPIEGDAGLEAFLSKVLAAMLPHCRDGAVLDLCLEWTRLEEVIAAIRRNGLTLLDLCVWNKQDGPAGDLYRSSHELICVARKGEAPHINNVGKSGTGRVRTNLWDYPGIKGQGSASSAIKPTALISDAISDVTHPGDIVLDPFAGSGTMLLACEQTKRRGYGIEIDSASIDVAIRRWEAMTGEQACLAATLQSFADLASERSTVARDDEDRREPPADNSSI